MNPSDSVISHRAVVEIRPPGGWSALNLREIYDYRDLLFLLARRDISARYKHTLIGAAWAVLQPLSTMVIFSVFFGHLLQVPSEGAPYPLFSYAALLAWQLFAGALSQASTSILAEHGLISYVYFPRMVVPLAAVMLALVDFAAALLVLIPLLLYYGFVPGWTIAALPFMVVLTVFAATGVGLWLSALTVKYRDFQYTVPFLLQAWLFITPVVYPAALVPAKWQALYALNPMVGAVEGFRWALLGNGEPPLAALATATIVVGVLLVSGAVFFRQTEHLFADMV